MLWVSSTTSCTGDSPAPPSAPADVEVVQVPPVPSMQQIQEASVSLPFCLPKPSMQLVGGRTLVNLPTFYKATSPDDGDCLVPGETSEAMQLLSWSIEFRAAERSYWYDFGDGENSGWTKSAGGIYPDGDIRDTYSAVGRVRVHVDATLTGSYRVDGGEWQAIDTVADLQDEPEVPYEVVEAKNRLVS